jgi:hypothetical protein
MSIQDIGDDLEAIADDLRQCERRAEEASSRRSAGASSSRIRVQAVKCRNPRGDYIDYEHDDGSDKITLCGIPIRGITKLTWIKPARGRPEVHLVATVRTRIEDVRRMAQTAQR